MKKEIIVYIPARLGSTRLKKKVLTNFRGKPLIFWTLTKLKEIKEIDLYVNTESIEISNYVKSLGVKVYKRNSNLAKNTTTTEEILADFIKHKSGKYILVINPTNPLVSLKTYKKIIKKVKEDKYQTLFTVSNIKKHCLIKSKPINYSPFGPHPRTQDVETVSFINWIAVCWDLEYAKKLIKTKGDSIYIGNVGFIETPLTESLDIDTFEEFNLAEAIHMTVYK